VECQEHSPSITAAQLKIITHDLGLDQPAYVQYWRWLTGLVQGRWGYSLQSGEAVTTLIGERLGNTLELAGTAFVLSLLLAIPLGVLAAIRPYSLFDYVATLFSFIAYSTPVFWAGLMAQLLWGERPIDYPADRRVQLDVPGPADACRVLAAQRA
jgi:peptide/nickel transport system permease protein